VFSPRGGAVASLGTSIWIAVLTVVLSLAVAVPAGYALARLRLRWRSLILLAFLLPQAVPNLPVYVNIARVFYEIGLNGTVFGVVLVHASHGLVLAVWIASAAFASVDASLEEAARNMGASPWTCFRTVTLPLGSARPHRQRDLRVPRVARRIHGDRISSAFRTSPPCRSSCSTRAWAATTRSRPSRRCCCSSRRFAFMLVVERFLKADVLAGVGK
jgi:hypothetical protein